MSIRNTHSKDMIPLYKQEEFNTSKGIMLLPLQCKCCSNTFYKSKYMITRYLNPSYQDKGDCCSMKCFNEMKRVKPSINCIVCGKSFHRPYNQIKRSVNVFCSKSCNATYQNAHKTIGKSRSKLEIWLEKQLRTIYPDIVFLFNYKTLVKLELDIYIPKLNVAFELNGITHYEPIYGVDKLLDAQRRDKSKSLFCHENQIDLCVIDTTKQNYFKESTSKQYLDIITNIIDERITSI